MPRRLYPLGGQGQASHTARGRVKPSGVPASPAPQKEAPRTSYFQLSAWTAVQGQRGGEVTARENGFHSPTCFLPVGPKRPKAHF